MNRRDFLVASSQAAGALGLAPLFGCATTGAASRSEFDPGSYVIGNEHLVFDGTGTVLHLTPHEHRITVESGRSSLGLGTDPGELNYPIDATFANGRIYVLDHGNGRIEVFSTDGQHQDSLATGLNMPHDLHAHGGSLYVCDSQHHAVLELDFEGNLLRSIGGPGDAEHELNGPRGLAFCSGGELHVVDAGDATVQVYGVDGTYRRSYGEHGQDDGQMIFPRSIAIGDNGCAYVSDPSCGRVHAFTEGGESLGSFAPTDDSGRAVTPFRVSFRPDGVLYIWTAGSLAHA